MPRNPSNTRRTEKCASAFTTTLRAPRNPSGTATMAAAKVPRKAIATLSPRPRRMSCHWSPGLGGTIWRRMVPSPAAPLAMRRGVMSNHQHSAASQASAAAAAAQRRAAPAGLGPKARGFCARSAATSAGGTRRAVAAPGIMGGCLLPLPPGEGWGEGVLAAERSARAPRS